jgi:hypothetical protein
VNDLSCDYLIVGSGAMGMSFADTLLHESDATMIMVDRHHQPGGHWNDAYPFVRLHQPSAFYGVNSKDLGSDTMDTSGGNKGLYELASNSEVVAYFDQVMQQTLLPSGRVQYFPNCEYDGHGAFHSLLSGKAFQVAADKDVDATYMNVTVPSIRPPQYHVDDDVNCEPPNVLPKVASEYERYVVVGAGKTAIDACLFLLNNGVQQERIAWIMPRDSWYLDRKNIQPGKFFMESIARQFSERAQDFAQAATITDLFSRVEKHGGLLRLDPQVEPSMYRCATVTTIELAQLRKISDIIRLGRVVAISQTEITLTQGKVPTTPGTLHIDCTADGLQRRPELPVFDGNTITLQTVRTCQQVFSAAFIAHIEASVTGHELKNELCTPVPHPDNAIDYMRANLGNMMNMQRWSLHDGLPHWLKHSRLDGFTDASQPAPDLSDPKVAERVASFARVGQAAVENVQRLLAEVDD